MDKYVVNARFSDIYNNLIKDKKIKGKSELASILGIGASTISEILGQRQGITVEFIQNFCSKFPEITPEDFFSEKSRNNVNMIPENKSDLKSEIITYLREKDQKIERLIRENARLETELDFCKKTLVPPEKNVMVADAG